MHTAAEQSYVESSSLSSRRSEIVTAALGNESSFLTSRVDTVGFNINFRTIPCLRIKSNEQPQIVELKQLATTNLRKRIAEVVDRFYFFLPFVISISSNDGFFVKSVLTLYENFDS